MYTHIKTEQKHWHQPLSHILYIGSQLIISTSQCYDKEWKWSPQLSISKKMNIPNADKTALRHYSNNQAKMLGHIWGKITNNSGSQFKVSINNHVLGYMQSILSETLNSRQSVTFCLAFRQFTRCLNGIKQFKLFYISCPKYIYLYMCM